MKQTMIQRERSSTAGLDATVEHILDERPEWRTANPLAGTPDPNTQPPAEDLCVGRVETPFCGPCLETRREHEVYDRIQATGSDHWLERAPEGGMFVCVRSRLSGRIFRYQFGYYDSIVRLFRWEYEQEKREKRWAKFDRLREDSRANLSEDAICPEPLDADDTWGTYTGPPRVATPPRE